MDRPADENKCKEAYLETRENVARLAQLAGREVQLLAVSKFQSAQKIRWLYECGQKTFGENYVQEAMAKRLELQGLGIDWHLIGHLQSNKVKLTLGQFALMESLDSLILARKLSQGSESLGQVQKVLVEVNLANETSKSGFSPKDLTALWSDLRALPGLQIMGLMSLPPLGRSAEDSRPYFRRLKALSKEINCSEILSMGTSNDYQVAIEEGATEVRLGTLLFGARQ